MLQKNCFEFTTLTQRTVTQGVIFIYAVYSWVEFGTERSSCILSILAMDCLADTLSEMCSKYFNDPWWQVGSLVCEATNLVWTAVIGSKLLKYYYTASGTSTFDRSIYIILMMKVLPNSILILAAMFLRRKSRQWRHLLFITHIVEAIIQLWIIFTAFRYK